jgi:hypothetical protein
MQQNKQGGACFNLTKSVRIRLQTKNRRSNLSPLHIHLSHVSHRVLLHFTQSHPISPNLTHSIPQFASHITPSLSQTPNMRDHARPAPPVECAINLTSPAPRSLFVPRFSCRSPPAARCSGRVCTDGGTRAQPTAMCCGAPKRATRQMRF